MPVEALTEEHFASIPRPVDLLAGGPPCPPFSKSRFYRTDKPRALNDPVADATISGYLKILGIVRPRTFLLENVPGLRYKVHQEALNYIESSAQALGYQTNWAVLNAADFGVPQIRFRFFMVGSLDGRKCPCRLMLRIPAEVPRILTCSLGVPQAMFYGT